MSDCLKDLEVELRRVLVLLRNITEWEKVGSELGLTASDLDGVRTCLQKESGQSHHRCVKFIHMFVQYLTNNAASHCVINFDENSS